MSISPFLDYGELFQMDDPLADRPLRLTSEGYSDWLTRKHAIALFRGELELEQSLKLGGYKGGQITDYLWGGFVHVAVISMGVVELLKECGFTGWATYPVKVYNRKGEPIEGFSGFSVTGRAGRRDRSRSTIITKPAPAARGNPYEVCKGYYFDEGQWDGSDIFLSDNRIIVTHDVQKAFRRAKVSNVRLTPLMEVEIRVLLDKYDQDFRNASK